MENDTFIERMFQYFEKQGVDISDLERKIGISIGYLKKSQQRNGSLGSNIVEKIVQNCPDLSLDWLFTGTGDMIKINAKNIQIAIGDRAQLAGTVKGNVQSRDRGLDNSEANTLKEKISSLNKELSLSEDKLSLKDAIIRSKDEIIEMLKDQLKKTKEI